MQHRLSVQDVSGVGEARRLAGRLATRAGLDDQFSGRLAIVVTELANNLVRHAREGEMLLQTLATAPAPEVEVLAIDRGPGMIDPDRCLRDGYSTGGTAGTGLGAVQRLASAFAIHSKHGSGTVVMARVAGPGAAAGRSQVGVVNLPYPGEEDCGDAWAVSDAPDGISMIVVDGLGHGTQAAVASAAAIRAFEETPRAAPDAIIDAAHRRMTSTRGGAMAVARYDGRRSVEYAGVGNIAGTLLAQGKSRGLASQNGTVGAQIRRLRTDEYACAPGTLVVLHSDGLMGRWSLDSYPGLAACHPSVIAGVLYRDFRRDRDDVTVLAVRLGEYPEATA